MRYISKKGSSNIHSEIVNKYNIKNNTMFEKACKTVSRMDPSPAAGGPAPGRRTPGELPGELPGGPQERRHDPRPLRHVTYRAAPAPATGQHALAGWCWVGRSRRKHAEADGGYPVGLQSTDADASRRSRTTGSRRVAL